MHTQGGIQQRTTTYNLQHKQQHYLFYVFFCCDTFLHAPTQVCNNTSPINQQKRHIPSWHGSMLKDFYGLLKIYEKEKKIFTMIETSEYIQKKCSQRNDFLFIFFYMCFLALWTLKFCFLEILQQFFTLLTRFWRVFHIFGQPVPLWHEVLVI